MCLRKTALFFITVIAGYTAVYGATAEDASVTYESRYQLTGYLMRAANVCMADKKQVEASFVLVNSPEMKAFTRAYPKITKEWMTRGAELFNASVMKEGIQPACDYALATLKKANALP